MSIRKSIEARLDRMSSEWGMFVTSMEVSARVWDDLMEELEASADQHAVREARWGAGSVLPVGGFVMLEFGGRNVHVSKRSVPRGRVFTYDPPA